MNADKLFGYFEARCDPRPLALFRILFYGGLAVHFGPSLIWTEENFSSTAFRTNQWNRWLYNAFESLSPNVVLILAVLTGVAVLVGILGLHARGAAIATALGLYTFTSFNALNLQTLALGLAWALLWLWALAGTGDEVWALKVNKAARNKLATSAPMLCRALIVLQLQLGLFFAGIEKITAGWPMTNEMHVLLSYPGGFILRPWVANQPFFEYQWVGMALTVLTLVVELGIPILFLFKKTRLPAVAAYQLFFLGIVAMLQVPPLFYAVYAGCGILVLSDAETRRFFGPIRAT